MTLQLTNMGRHYRPQRVSRLQLLCLEPLESRRLLSISSANTTHGYDDGMLPARSEAGQYLLDVSDTPAILAASVDNASLLDVTNSIPGAIDGYNVSIDRHDAPAELILPSLTTWLVIHGNSSAPTTSYIDELASTLHTESGGHQVLTLDWSEIAAEAIGTTENYILTVAQWASTALTTYGFGGSLLNLAGHSFGAYVAAELAEDMAGGVNTILGLDPAEDWPFAPYDPEDPGQIDFAGHSQYSWAFSDAGGSYGSETTPGSADEAIAVKDTTHSGVVSLFSNMLNGVGDANVLMHFPLSRLLAYDPGPWVPDQYNHAGNPASPGTYEAVITADDSEIVALSIDYVPLTPSVTVTVTAPDGGEDWQVSSIQDVTWTTTDDSAVTSVDLYYSSSGLAGPFAGIAFGEPNDGVYPWPVPDDPTTNAFVKVVAHDTAGSTVEDISDAPFAISAAPATLLHLADADLPVAGSVEGTYLDTHSSDGELEVLTERQSGGKPANRYSYLEHKWTFDVTSGASVEFFVQAHRSGTEVADEFVFAYSTDDANYVEMLTVSTTVANDAHQGFALPNDLNGTMYVRVTDTDRSPGQNSLDTLSVNHMYILSSDTASLPMLSISDVVVTEGNSGEQVDAVFTVTRTGDTSEVITVDYATQDGSALISNNDYLEKSGVLTIPAGDAEGTITVHVVGDDDPEGDENFVVNLTSVSSNADILDPSGVATILNDDAVADPNGMYVWDIEFFRGLRGKKQVDWINVTVNYDLDPLGSVGGSDLVLSGADVTIDIIDDAGATIRSFSGTTDGDGRFEKWIQPLPTGMYAAEVVSLTHPSFVWNQGLDPVTSNGDTDDDNDEFPEQWLPVGTMSSSMTSLVGASLAPGPVAAGSGQRQVEGSTARTLQAGEPDIQASVYVVALATTTVRPMAQSINPLSIDAVAESGDPSLFEPLDNELVDVLAVALTA